MASGPLSSNRRAYRQGGLTRFTNQPVTEPSPRSEARLPPSHPAIVGAHTMFPSRVFDAGQRDRILIEGINNAKIGNRVTKGPWAGFRIYTFALEERATCPRSCHLFSECYGNALPLAVRFHFNDGFLMSLEEELVMAGQRHPKGFAVRAHVLGDFPSIDYVRHWMLWLSLVPQVHVWGYTAHPADSDIGAAVLALNETFPGRWAFRNSVAPSQDVGPWQASAIWDKPARAGASYRGAGGLVCPAETGATATCGTCGLCWSPAAANTRIVFLGHGKRHKPIVAKPIRLRQPSPQPAPPSRPRPFVYAPVARHDPALDNLIANAVEAGRITRIPQAKAKAR